MQKSSSSFKQGDIVVAQILFSEQIGVKRRPALVISNSDYNKKSDDLILLKITSRGKRTDFDVLLTQRDLAEGTLKVESQIMVDNPVTAYKKIISEKIATVNQKKLKEVKQKIKKLYGL